MTNICNVVGIDPGIHTGIAVVSLSGSLVLHTHVHSSSNLLDVVSDLTWQAVTHAAIENQYHGPNAATTIKLSHNAGLWHGLCIANSIDVELVMPQTWQTAELGCGPRTRRDQRKKLAIQRCKALWGVTLTSDVADAALIARWRAVQLAELERIRRLGK